MEYQDLGDELAQYLESEKLTQIQAAYQVAKDAHRGQSRVTGEDYISHPLAVAFILAQMRMDHESIMAALLHDVLEDTTINKTTLSAQFGETVADLVDGVSKLTQIKFESKLEQQAENFRKMLLAMVQDIRVILVKLADRLHNMRTLGVLSSDKRRRIARETLEIYAPIANRLGIHTFKVEFEELGFAAYYPFRSKTVKEAVQKARGNRKEIIHIIESALKKGLTEYGIDSSVLHGREKHLYSIYKKMRSKKLSLSQVMDVYAFRIIVDRVDTCYRVLGLVHGLYKPVPGRFKDYIAIPKANGYRSLHTTLFGPYGVPIEIQIRTQEMHYMAEQGIAAHWLYKTPESSLTAARAKANTWLKGLMEIQQNAGTSVEFMQNVKIDLFPDEVYVFTPKGDIMELPMGATAVDFAYTVHTDIGNSCVAARVDRQLAPLSIPLLNGQSVEIITLPGATPNPSWLNFVTTGKARSSIRHFLKSQQRTELITLGQRLLSVALSRGGISWEELPKEGIEHVLAESKLNGAEALFAEIGMGNQTAQLVARRLLDYDAEKINRIMSAKEEPLAIKGTEGMVINFAKCCWPIPGDQIVGYFSHGQGLTVHTETCRKMAVFRDNPDKCIPLRWSDELTKEYQIEIIIEVMNVRGMLAQLSALIADQKANIDSIHSEEKDSNYSVVTVILAVVNRDHLARIIRKLRAVKAVIGIQLSR